MKFNNLEREIHHMIRIFSKSAAAALVACAAAAISAADASAQGRFSIAGGPAFAMGDLGDIVDTGYHAQLSAGLSVPMLPVGVRIDGQFTQFPESGEDGNFRVLSGSVNGVLSMPSVLITPYLIGGLGLYNSRFTDEDEDHGHEHDEGSTTNVGANLGAGVRVGLPGLTVFGEARLHNLFSDGGSTRFVPISFGISF
jgi:hypothetical protein